ncbi:MAG: methyltransferase domain-containing protein [Nitrospirales bacterium]|nr:methyltransferase domain-containing protein [Nitrospirales bacterium]
MNLSEKMKRDWDRRAQHHARFWIATEDYHSEKIFTRSGEATAHSLLRKLHGRHARSWRVMDIGCGIGRVLKPLAPYFTELIGVDVSSEMIAQSKIWLAEHPNIATHETSGVDLQDFPDHYFDLVYSYVAFQHMPRPVFECYLKEVHRILKPHGYFLFQLPLGPFLDTCAEDTIGIRRYTVLELCEKLHRNGFLMNLASPYSTKDLTQAQDHDFIMTINNEKNFALPAGKSTSLECFELGPISDAFSSFELQMYSHFADRRFAEGQTQEAIKTLQILVEHNPHHLSGWLHLATLFVETGQIHQALSTLSKLKSLHPRYEKAHHTFQQLLTKFSSTSVDPVESACSL